MLLDHGRLHVELAVDGAEGLHKLDKSQLRPGAARPDDAGPVRHGSAAEMRAARPRDADLHDHRLRLGGGRGGRAQGRRERLLLQALGQREAADRDRPHDRARRRLERENTHLKRALKQRYSFPNIIGKSERMLRVLDLVAQVAPSRVDHPDHR